MGSLLLAAGSVLSLLVGASPATAALAPALYLSPHLVDVDHVPGRILDVSPRRILFGTGNDRDLRLHIKNRVTGEFRSVPGGYSSIGLARLTDDGVAFIGWVGGDTEDQVVAWHGGEHAQFLGAAQTLLVRNSYLIWTHGRMLYRRDLVSRSTALVAINAEPYGNELLPGGDVLFRVTGLPGSPGALYRYHDSVVTVLPTATRFARGPIGDRSGVVYCGGRTRRDRCELWRSDGSRHVRLTGVWPDQPDPEPASGYDVAGGWSAFVRRHGASDLARVWLRDPDGRRTPVSAPAEPYAETEVVGLSHTGEVLYAVRDSLYLGAPRRAPELLAAGVGRWHSGRTTLADTVRFLDDHWLLASGGTLYRYGH